MENVQILQYLGDNWDSFLAPSEGLSGGILFRWRKDVAIFNVKEVSSQVVVGNLEVLNRKCWLVSTVYGSRNSVDRKLLWEKLENLNTGNLPAVIGGDFNCILSQEEKRGGKKFTFSQGARDMKGFMNNNDFHEIGFVGPKFTWCNNKSRSSRILERLDRCLLNSYAMNSIQLALVKHLSRFASDHCPIILEIFKPITVARKDLRFEDVWTSYHGATALVEKSWNKLEEAEGLLEDSKLAVLRSKINELNCTLARLNIWWRQRAKVRWLEDRDANTTFFHTFANARRCSNWIKHVITDDGWQHGNGQIDGWPKPFNLLEAEDQRLLESDFSKDELQKKLCLPKQKGGRGLFSAANKVGHLRAKFALEFYTKQDSLLNCILRAKYGENLWEKHKKNGCSSTWKILCNGAIFLTNIVRWRICNGNSIDWMNDTWLQDKSLSKWPTFVNTNEVANNFLNFFISNGIWIEEHLRLYFNEDLVEMITNVPIYPEKGNDQIEIKWKHTGCSKLKKRKLEERTWKGERKGWSLRGRRSLDRILRECGGDIHTVDPTNMHLSTIGFKGRLEGSFRKKKISLVSKDLAPPSHQGSYLLTLFGRFVFALFWEEEDLFDVKGPGSSAAPGKVKVILYRLLHLAVLAKGESLCGTSAILGGCLRGVDVGQGLTEPL
ncbi:hypothetical protein KFK09_004689 [Dendrobium nobile]|uniref:Endonuclease/exonuclease/phosphatase domain-containing protein n=1 Tax=Dendrobium nobile TaxID=94219 RepID=A0A8T3BTS9_DENNO|nr:hypothetical protein KFK09_004689 [Dendrobium nobile]